MSKKLISWDDVALELPSAVKASLDADYDPAGAAAAATADAALMITEQSDADKAAAISTYLTQTTGTASPSRTDKWRVKLAGVRAGTGFAKVLCIGDSTTHGVGGAVIRTDSYPAQLRALLHSEFAPSWGGLSIAPYFANGNDDTRWTTGSGWSMGGGTVAWADSSTWQASSGASGALTYRPYATADSFDIYWVRNVGFGTLTASLNGGAGVPIPTNGAAGIQKTTITGASVGDPILSITNGADGQAFVIGVDSWSSTLKSVRVGNAGVSTSTTFKWQTDGPSFKSIDAIKAYAPDLTVLMLGINDASTPETTANFNLYLSRIIDACKISGDVILGSVIPSAPLPANPGRDVVAEAAYRDEMKKLAKYKGCVFIDIMGRWGDFATANAKGWMVDGLHCTTAGYADVARAVADTIELI